MSKKETQDECTGRACIVEYNHEGTWKPAQFKDRDRKHPAVHSCDCGANRSILELALTIAAAVLAGKMPVSDMPDPEGFRVTFVDEEALPPEVEVEGTEQASDIINSIRSKA